MTELGAYLSQRYGGLIVRDNESPTGLREWSEEDTRSLTAWLESNAASDETTCLNLAQTAGRLGVSIHTAKGFMRRNCNPLPTIRNGRRILVPLFLLVRWMEEEVQRQREGRHS